MKDIEVLRAGMSRKRREEVEGEVAHLGQLWDSIEEERERFGEHPGEERLNVTHTHVRSYIDTECDCWRCECGAYMPRDVRPADNPAHRERHGLEGAFDVSCDDICCTPKA